MGKMQLKAVLVQIRVVCDAQASPETVSKAVTATLDNRHSLRETAEYGGPDGRAFVYRAHTVKLVGVAPVGDE